MLSIFSAQCFIIFPSCAAEDACNDAGGGNSAGKRSLKFFVMEEKRGVSVTTTEQHQRGKLAFGIRCPSSWNKTRPLEVRGEGGQNQTPFCVVIGERDRARAGLRGLLISLSCLRGPCQGWQ